MKILIWESGVVQLHYKSHRNIRVGVLRIVRDYAVKKIQHCEILQISACWILRSCSIWSRLRIPDAMAVLSSFIISFWVRWFEQTCNPMFFYFTYVCLHGWKFSARTFRSSCMDIYWTTMTPECVQFSMKAILSMLHWGWMCTNWSKYKRKHNIFKYQAGSIRSDDDHFTLFAGRGSNKA